jgi:hypothetical protein
MRYIGMILAPMDSQPERKSDVVVSFLRMEQVEVLVVVDQFFESAAARRFCRVKLLL